MNQNNLIYFSGPHGSGKTSLMKVLAECDDYCIKELYSRNIKFDTEPNYRRALRIAGRAIENYEYLEIAKKNPNKIILGNRCIYDVMAYDKVYQEKGWITNGEYNLLKLAKLFFPNENEMPYAIVVNPGFEVTWKHLSKRWKESPQKWKEDDKEYCAIACKSYEQFKNNEKILYIDRELDLESKLELKPIVDWMKDKSK